MTSQQLEERSAQLEARVAALESDLARLRPLLTLVAQGNVAQFQSPWWQKVAGSFQDNPAFDKAVRLGQEWRRSAE